MKYVYYVKKFWLCYLMAAVMCISATIGADRAVTTIAENRPLDRHFTIVIDAGHGGIDGGATSCTGVLESQINLQMALRLEDVLHLLGYQTKMIRRSDESIYTEGNTIAAQKASDLRQRVRIVNSTEKAILISIHQNIFADSQYHGPQVFYAPTDGSRELANILQDQLVEALNPGSNRRSRVSSGVYLMQHIERTGVLIECGFLSNPKEEALLRDAGYQKKLCCVIVSGLSMYINA